MMFLNRICTICLFLLLTTYNADSYKWRTKELGNNIYSLKYSSHRRLVKPLNNTHSSLNYSSHRRLVEPLSYQIFMIIAFDKVTFTGDIKTWIIIEYPTIQLNLSVHGLIMRERDIYFYRHPYRERYRFTKVFYLNETATLILDFETEIPSGIYEMHIIKFTGNISESETGLYRTICKDCDGSPRFKYKTRREKWLYMTQLKPAAAPRVFPCWDECALRTRFTFEIGHHRKSMFLSNMPILSHWTLNDYKFTKFDSTPPIPSYLVAFAMLRDFVCSTKKKYDITTRVCSTSLAKDQIIFALNTSAEVTAYLQQYMKISPQLSEITHIGLPNFSYETAENWGFNIYRENHLIYNETLHPIEYKLNVSMYVSSLVALQWFGNLVSPTSWTDMWFSQTLALFYGVKAFTKIYGDEEITSLFTYQLQSLAREDHVVSQVRLLKYPANNLDETDKLIKSSHFTNCLKEYAIITMLEHVVSESIFQRATITYLEKYRLSTATPNDFLDVLQDIIAYFNLPLSITQIVQSWFNQRSLPVIMVTRNLTNNYIIIRREHTHTEEDGNHTDDLLLPINYITHSHPENISSIIWLDRKRINGYHISSSNWIIVNWQYTGYYRVKYDKLLLDYLGMCLHFGCAKVNAFNRAHIIEDAYYFWSKKELSISDFIGTLNTIMTKEEHCAPWYAMQNIIKKIWVLLNVEFTGNIKVNVEDILLHLLNNVGYTEYPNDTECVKFKRLLATKWSCRLLHRTCLEIAQKRFLDHIRDPKKHQILPTWEEWTYCNGLMLSNDDQIWFKIFRDYQITRNKRVLKYLVCSERIPLIRDYLKISMSKDPILWDMFGLNFEDVQQIYRWIIKRHISKKEVFDCALKKIVRMQDEYEIIEKLSYIIENVYSQDQLYQIQRLLDTELVGFFYSERLRILTFKIYDQMMRITTLHNAYRIDFEE